MSQIITDLDQIRQLASDRNDEFEVLRYTLELYTDLTDEQLDQLVEGIAQPIIDAIDCTKCGNCCRSLDVYLTPEDTEQLANGIHIPVDEIITNYVDHDSARKVGEWGKFKHRPCTFLKDRLCTVYAHRPETCRTYPAFTPDFRWMLEDIIDGAGICPIIYNVLSTMVEMVEDRYKTGSE